MTSETFDSAHLWLCTLQSLLLYSTRAGIKTASW